jgi:hypothetical protein
MLQRMDYQVDVGGVFPSLGESSHCDTSLVIILNTYSLEYSDIIMQLPLHFSVFLDPISGVPNLHDRS